ncbi:MAG: methyltransferase domain-containing protein [Elusimicrobia bacterium]|nr:methyltransferase domain-containing protein [Elusimicrobiota bacterium]
MTRSHVPPAHLHWLTPVYDILCSAMGLGRDFRKDIVRRLGLTGRERLLDAGCGTAALLESLLEAHPGLDAAGADPDAMALAIASEKLDRKGPRPRLELAPMDRLPFEEAWFDVVVSTLALHHVPRRARESSLRECSRVLKPGGRLVVADLVVSGAGPARWLLNVLALLEDMETDEGLMALLRSAGFRGARSCGRWNSLVAFYEAVKG